jgi:glycolate oxidase FAD binding subunit
VILSIRPQPLSQSAPTTTAAVAAAVREAAARNTPLRIAGHGGWLTAGRPVRSATPLPLGGLTGIVEYTPGDLTLTARAGTSLAELARATAAERQWLALDPFGSAEGTLGATVATASAGPLAHAFGTPRDNVLGLEFVTGTGDVVRGGGRVVKNVAGFDLVRLLTGSWGTLGAITEVTVRLRAEADVDRTVAVAAPAAELLDPWLARVRAAPLVAWTLELLNDALAARVGLERRPVLLVRVAGNVALVRAQQETLAALGDTAVIDAGVWTRLRECEEIDSFVWRTSDRPSRLTALVQEHLVDRDGHGLLMHASVGRGVARFVAPLQAFDLGRRDRRESTHTTVFERAPSALWARPADATLGRLTRRVKQAFDPLDLLNPGIL